MSYDRAVSISSTVTEADILAEIIAPVSDAKLFANRSALFANDAESAMIACSLL